jgi:hypothetical protein
VQGLKYRGLGLEVSECLEKLIDIGEAFGNLGKAVPVYREADLRKYRRIIY